MGKSGGRIMKLRMALAAVCLAGGSLLGSAVAQAATYDLAADLYTINQPGSAWSATYSGGGLAQYPKASVVNNNHLYSALPTEGIISAGGSGNMNVNTPFMFRAAVNGSATDPDPSNHTLTDGDFMAGDAVIHSPNSGTLTITWKAPSAGTISNLDFSVWYAHSTQPTRSNDVTFSFGSLVFNDLHTSATDNPARPGTAVINGGGFAVAANQLLTLTLAKSAAAEFGSLSGVALSFAFQSAVTPIPATLPLFGAGLAGLGWIARRRQRQTA